MKPGHGRHAAGRRAGRRPGFTLIEVAFVMAILAIVVAVAVPNYSSYLARQRLRHVAELLELDLRRARALSVDEGRNIHVSFQSGPQWCWGASSLAVCDCGGGEPRCELSSTSSREHKGMLLQSGQGITFELGWARIGISNERNQQLHIDLNPLGRPAICGSDARKGSC